MRKILFQGRDHAGKWHKGNKFSRLEENPDTDTEWCRLAYYIQNDAGEEHEVDPETIIQLVCPATEEHPEIWEGDIIEDKDYRMVLTYSDSRQEFYLIAHSKTSAEYKPLNVDYLDFKFKDGRAKVVGNIHDTREAINPLNKPFSQAHEKGITTMEETKDRATDESAKPKDLRMQAYEKMIREEERKRKDAYSLWTSAHQAEKAAFKNLVKEILRASPEEREELPHQSYTDAVALMAKRWEVYTIRDRVVSSLMDELHSYEQELENGNNKALKQDYAEKLYETAKEVAKDLPIGEAARIFTYCLIRDTKPTLDATSITLEMADFEIEVKLKFQTEG